MSEERRPSPLLLRRFLQLPRPGEETWQGGIVAMPTWIKSGPDAAPERPWAAVWVSRSTGLVHLELEGEFGRHGPELGLQALVQFGLKRYKGMPGRPSKIQVADPALGEFVARELGDPDLVVEVVPDLDAVRYVLRMFAEDTSRRPVPPGPLAGAGVTVDRMRAFAGAAAAFWRAEPWQHLTDADMIRIEAPAPPAALAWLTVLGNAGLSRGIRFDEHAPDMSDFERPPAGGEAPPGPSFWALFFGAIDEMPFEDADLWLDPGFPVAGPEAHPWLVRARSLDDIERADRAVLVFVEAVLRALAATTEDQIDSGRWSARVETHDGPVVVTLALPLVLHGERDDPRWRPFGLDRRAMERSFVELERMKRDRPAASAADLESMIGDYVRQSEAGERPAAGMTPVDRAQDLVFDAFEARGRRRVVLAREALALDPDAADALVILAEHAAGPERAYPIYQQALEAGRRRLGRRTLELEMGRFWDLVSTRPYMRALLGLADTLVALGRADEALGFLQDMLRLNPNDNQGARFRLLSLFIDLERYGDAETLTELFPDEESAIWPWSRALLSFRRTGDTPEATRLVQAALTANRRTAALLIRTEPPADGPPVSIEPGSAGEATVCARQLHALWHATPGAAAWLRRVAMRSHPSTAPRGRSRSGRKPRR